MPWLRGEATGLPGLRTANLQRDHGSRLESSFFRAMEDVKICVRFSRSIPAWRLPTSSWLQATSLVIQTPIGLFAVITTTRPASLGAGRSLISSPDIAFSRCGRSG